MAPPFVVAVLGWRDIGQDRVSNVADTASVASKAISARMLELCGVTRIAAASDDPGVTLERGVEDYLADELPRAAPTRSWDVSRRRLIAGFQQYAHLARLDELIKQDETGTLKSEIGLDYLIAPDVTVGIETAAGRLPILHAAVSCKWTIRSDRVQNIRHEGIILTRHRRGRQPHIVTVTLEPLPSRLASIARGTGEVDAVYHAALSELTEAVQQTGSAEQQRVLRELIGQERLLDFGLLVPALTV